MKTAIITFTDPLHLDHSGVSYEITFGAATDGKDGIDGKSAYQSAVEGGFQGTEKEFNESISKFTVSDSIRYITVVEEYPEVEELNTLYIKLKK